VSEADAFRATCTDFHLLPPTIQRAHTGRIRLEGRVRVTRGGKLANMIADALGLPKAGDNVAMTVDGDHLADCMIWDRHLDGRRFRSCFRRAGNHLVESIGPFQLQLRVAAIDGRLRYLLDCVTLFGLPWPARLAPHLDAWEGEADGRYDFGVEVCLPFVGPLVRYRGQLDLLAPSA
jgi:hypothetical protein